MPKLCEFELCKNRAVYGFNNEMTFCKNHKIENMKYYDYRKCKCNKNCSFNYPTEKKPLYCGDCKLEGMVDVKNKKCITCNKKIPNFNYPNEKTPLYCGDCKKDNMIDINHPKCKANDKTLCNSRGNKKYKGYCSRCYQYLFPKDPLTYQIRSKTKEIAVRDFINDNYNGFCHDKPLYTAQCDCSIRRRIDHRILINNTLLCIETDENQHKSYDEKDEEIRYDDLYNAFSGKWIFIRFNPDVYKINGKKKNTSISTRLTQLKKEIDKQIKRIENEENIDLLEVIKMYYDE